jgi:hypothetical protein
MDVMAVLLKELNDLPEACRLSVLTYVRLLKLGMAPPVGGDDASSEGCLDAVEQLRQYPEFERRAN